MIRKDLQWVYGVYAIVNKTKNRCYIGMSENVFNRINSHLALLKKGKHYNKRMQKDFSSGDKFNFILLEEVGKGARTELQMKEDFYISIAKRSHKYKLYNIDVEFSEKRYFDRMAFWKGKRKEFEKMMNRRK